MDQLGIGDLARQTGLNPSAIRYYERMGLLPEPAEERLLELDVGGAQVDTSSKASGSSKRDDQPLQGLSGTS